MKTTLNLPKEVRKQITYPCFMIADKNLVVYFIKENEGYVVSKSNSENSIGVFSNDWNMAFFKPMPKGSSITIEF